ncbi:MAG: hypothetical protein IJW62_08430, partial [Clostridia bacterium]|nr:hypothetical protein [Clostridia bacterium]
YSLSISMTLAREAGSEKTPLRFAPFRFSLPAFSFYCFFFTPTIDKEPKIQDTPDNALCPIVRGVSA